MENIVRHLEDLDRESSTGRQTSYHETRDTGTNSDVRIKCDSTVPEESQVADQLSWSLPAAEAGDSHGRRVNASSSSSSGLVTTGTGVSPSSENLQAEERHHTEVNSEILRLESEVNSLRADLRRSDDTVLLLKRHIELNTASDGSTSPSCSPDVIIALVQEVERLNTELEKLSVEGRLNETVPASDRAPPVSYGHRQLLVQGEQSISQLSVQSLDSTFTAGNAAAAADSNMRQKSASFDDLLQLHDKLQDKPLTKDDMQSCDMAAAGDGTKMSVDPLSAARFSFTGDHRSFVGSPAGRDILRQSTAFSHSPFHSTSAANQRAFAELQAEVERLRRRLAMTELENSRLLERSARESVGSLTVVAPGRPSINSQTDVSLCLDGSLVRCSASGDVTVAAGFLKKLVSVSIFGFVTVKY